MSNMNVTLGSNQGETVHITPLNKISQVSHTGMSFHNKDCNGSDVNVSSEVMLKNQSFGVNGLN